MEKEGLGKVEGDGGREGKGEKSQRRGRKGKRWRSALKVQERVKEDSQENLQ